MKGYIGHTDHDWWNALRSRFRGGEVNFWRPRPRRFSALAPGEPFFFRLKAPIDRIGGFGLFARYAALPVWRAWEVFGEANGFTIALADAGSVSIDFDGMPFVLRLARVEVIDRAGASTSVRTAGEVNAAHRVHGIRRAWGADRPDGTASQSSSDRDQYLEAPT